MCSVVGVVFLTAVACTTGAGGGGGGGREEGMPLLFCVESGECFWGNPRAGVALGMALVAVEVLMEM